VMQQRQEGGFIVRGGRVGGHRSVVAAYSVPSSGQQDVPAACRGTRVRWSASAGPMRAQQLSD
jgi:hypothetical protein